MSFEWKRTVVLIAMLAAGIAYAVFMAFQQQSAL